MVELTETEWESTYNLLFQYNSSFVDHTECQQLIDNKTPDLAYDKKSIFDCLSEEAQQIIDICLYTPSEFFNLIYTPTKRVSTHAKKT